MERSGDQAKEVGVTLAMELLWLNPNQDRNSGRIRCKLGGRFLRNGDKIRILWPDGTIEQIVVDIQTERTESGVLRDTLWHAFCMHGIKIPFKIPSGIFGELISESALLEEHVL